MRNRAFTAVLLGTALAFAACQKQAPPPPSPSPGGLASDEQKTLYALGAVLGRNLAALKLSDQDLGPVRAGFKDASENKTLQVDLQTFGPRIQQFVQAKMAAAAQAEKEKAKTFQESAAKESGAVKLPSGVVYRTLTPGGGQSPTAKDAVKVHYHGTLTDGTVFDSSVQRGQPVEFRLNGVIPCWTEGVQRMKVGEKARLVCPSDTAYGDQGRPPTIPGGATLTFEVELLEVKK